MKKEKKDTILIMSRNKYHKILTKIPLNFLAAQTILKGSGHKILKGSDLKMAKGSDLKNS